MTGTGVMIYLAPAASLDLETNHLDMTLSAPTSGVYKGIIFYQDRTNSSPVVLGKNDGTLTFNGALYFPSATLTMKNENSGLTTTACTLIVAGAIDMAKPHLEVSNTCSDFGGSPLLTVAMAE